MIYKHEEQDQKDQEKEEEQEEEEEEEEEEEGMMVSGALIYVPSQSRTLPGFGTGRPS